MSTIVGLLKTMADLIKFADPDPARSADVPMPAAIELLGYHEPGDGGGGLFHWEADTKSKADNSILVSTYAKKPVTRPEKERTGCYKRQLSEPISVKWFGARGDMKGTVERYKGSVIGSKLTITVPKVSPIFTSDNEEDKYIVIWKANTNDTAFASTIKNINGD